MSKKEYTCIARFVLFSIYQCVALESAFVGRRVELEVRGRSCDCTSSFTSPASPSPQSTCLPRLRHIFRGSFSRWPNLATESPPRQKKRVRCTKGPSALPENAGGLTLVLYKMVSLIRLTSRFLKVLRISPPSNTNVISRSARTCFRRYGWHT
jgi:hypothetical protein